MVREIFNARQKAQDEKQRQGQQPTRRIHPELAADARKARQEFAKGKAMADSIEYAFARAPQREVLAMWLGLRLGLE